MDLGENPTGFMLELRDGSEQHDPSLEHPDILKNSRGFFDAAQDPKSPRNIAKPFGTGAQNYGAVRPEAGGGDHELAGGDHTMRTNATHLDLLAEDGGPNSRPGPGRSQGAPENTTETAAREDEFGFLSTEKIPPEILSGANETQLTLYDPVLAQEQRGGSSASSTVAPPPGPPPKNITDRNPFVAGMGQIVTAYAIEKDGYFYDGQDLLEANSCHQHRIMIDYVAKKYYVGFERPHEDDKTYSYQEIFKTIERILDQELHHRFIRLCADISGAADSIPGIVKLEQRAFTEFAINYLDIPRYKDLIDKLHRKRFQLFKRKEYEIRNKWERPFYGSISKYRPQSVNYAEELGNDNELVREFREAMTDLYAKHVQQFSRQAGRHLEKMAAIQVREEEENLYPQFSELVVLSVCVGLERKEGVAVCSALCIVGRFRRKSGASVGFVS